MVVYGGPQARLVDLVVSPHDLLDSRGNLRLHGIYYITKQIIPAVERIFNLVGADVKSWFNYMPKDIRNRSRSYLLPTSSALYTTSSTAATATFHAPPGVGAGRTIDQYYKSQHCVVCGELVVSTNTSSSTKIDDSCVCKNCKNEPQRTYYVLLRRHQELERHKAHMTELCFGCTGITSSPIIKCISLDCPVFYERSKLDDMLTSSTVILEDCSL